MLKSRTGAKRRGRNCGGWRCCAAMRVARTAGGAGDSVYLYQLLSNLYQLGMHTSPSFCIAYCRWFDILLQLLYVFVCHHQIRILQLGIMDMFKPDWQSEQVIRSRVVDRGIDRIFVNVDREPKYDGILNSDLEISWRFAGRSRLLLAHLIIQRTRLSNQR